MSWRIFVVMLVVTALAGGLAGWAGAEYGLHHATTQDDLDTVLHRDLDLTADQKTRIGVLESTFATDRAGYQVEMRAANRQLAAALTQAHPEEQEIERGVRRFHTAMEALQVRTVKHVLSMRSVLTPQQVKIFDATVQKTLGTARP